MIRKDFLEYVHKPIMKLTLLQAAALLCDSPFFVALKDNGIRKKADIIEA